MSDEKKIYHDLSDKTEFIKEIETWNSGGYVMLDIIWLKSGKILVISDEVVCKYDCIEQFMGDEGDYQYEKNCTDLIDPDLDEKQPVYDSSMIGRPFEYNGVEITNPFVSECGRFTIKHPEFYYGKPYLDSLKGGN